MRLYKVEAHFSKHEWQEWFVLALTEELAKQKVAPYTTRATSVSAWEQDACILVGKGSVLT